MTTLGGLRPGLPTVLNPGKPCLVWMPCIRRARDDAGGSTQEPHCWFLALSNWTSFYCPACYATIAHVIIVPKGHTLTHAQLLERAGFTLPEVEQAIEWTSAKDEVASFTAPAPLRAYRTRAEWLEDYTERAAMFEYLGEIPRPQAEAMARALVGAFP